ncbi:MAG: hypothetical protein QXP66_03880 [Candidatus Aenigmatarchaeota archaeon]
MRKLKKCPHGIPLKLKNECFFCLFGKESNDKTSVSSPKPIKKKQSLYTISTRIFTSLEEAEKQLNEWYENDTLNKESMVFEIKKVYKPKIKVEGK